MAMSAVVVTSAKSLMSKLLFLSSSIATLKFPHPLFSITATTTAAYGTLRNKSTSVTQKQKQKRRAELLLKRRTRSERELDEEGFENKYRNDSSAHVPVMLGEVLDVFASVPLKSFVDCTLGAGGHSVAIIEAHPEMELYVGLDVDPIAHEIARTRINGVLEKNSGYSRADLRVHTLLKNFKETNAVLQEIHGNPSGVQGILMDLGMSSMQVNNADRGFSVLGDGPLDMRMNPQASLKADDILNLWPDVEVGRILRDYGEESNWLSLQKKIVRARSSGGIHSTCELVDLIRRSTSWTRGGRHGWIKTSTRVFQALRIAVNDELNTLKDSIHTCFDRLASGGRLAIITFHSLEDRIVKQSFLDVINRGTGAVGKNKMEKEAWVKQMVHGPNGVVLTKRPITPSGSEERLNPRSRSAKLRVIEKV